MNHPKTSSRVGSSSLTLPCWPQDPAMSFSKPGALSSFNSTNYLIICSSTVVKHFNVLISTSPGSFLWKMNTFRREVSFWFLHEKNLTMQQRIPGSSTNLASHPFPPGFLHHHFCFCRLCLRCLQSCLGWAFSGFHKSFFSPHLSQQ